MTQEFYTHIENNIVSIDTWIENHSKLQASSDILQPLIIEFKKANPDKDVEACSDCIIDMLIWCKIQYKKQSKKK